MAAQRKGYEPPRCKDCNLPIRFLHPMRPDGKKIPVDISPDPEVGTVREVKSGTAHETVYRGQILRGTDLDIARADGEPLWMRHAETCTAHKPYNPKPAHVTLNIPAAPRRPRRRYR